ncbi:MAG: P-type conjugative transfer ATPase TrbB [Synergistaceae bacterium]|jgi:type IV secretion system protein VirB11|nr:P-type conjugative transfer ATPase TrbB [Synergistaceae bacterium]
MMTDEVRRRLIEKMKRELGDDILAMLNDGDVTEVMLNDDGHVWTYGRGGAVDTGVTMSAARSLSFLGTVASFYGKTIHAENTILAEVLPVDGSRINGVIPPTAEMPSFNIRKRATRIFTLDEYVSANRMTQNDLAIIRDAIHARKNFLVVGATGSGKTTLTNAILHEINALCPDHRIISMEDTAELQIPQKNKVRMYTDDHTSMQKLLFSAMRQKPDRIVIGEIRNSAALDLLKSWNTGHPGGVTTLHANSCLEALSRLEMLILEAVPNPMQRLIGQAVGLVIYIEPLATGPTVTEVMEVIDYDHAREEYVVEWIKRERSLGSH